MFVIKTGQIVWKSKEWWEVYTKGINPEPGCVHFNEHREANPEIISVACQKQLKHLVCLAPEIENKNWEAYKTRKRREGRTPEDYDCCQEDGTPCCSKQQSRQRRQRRKEIVGN